MTPKLTDSILCMLVFLSAVSLDAQAGELKYDNDKANRASCLKQAKAGDAKAQFILSNIYSNEAYSDTDVDLSVDLSQDNAGKDQAPVGEPKHIMWLRRSAEQGYAPAQLTLGSFYSAGLDVPLDAKTAVAWYQKAAAQGEPGAMLFLGEAYENGVGIPQDYGQAVTWYKKSIVGGSFSGKLSGTFHLAVMHERGLGVTQDPTKAVALYQQAAENGHIMASKKLAQIYATGQGVKANDVMVYQWIYIFSDKYAEDPAAKELRGKLQGKLTEARIAAAKAQAEAWMKRHHYRDKRDNPHKYRK